MEEEREGPLAGFWKGKNGVEKNEARKRKRIDLKKSSLVHSENLLQKMRLSKGLQCKKRKKEPSFFWQ